MIWSINKIRTGVIQNQALQFIQKLGAYRKLEKNVMSLDKKVAKPR